MLVTHDVNNTHYLVCMHNLSCSTAKPRHFCALSRTSLQPAAHTNTQVHNKHPHKNNHTETFEITDPSQNS